MNTITLTFVCGTELPELVWEHGSLPKRSKELFAENLRKLMDEKGVKGTALAKAAGVTSGVVTRWRDGDISPSVERLSDIADFLGIPVSRLFEDDTDKRSIGISPEAALRILSEAIRGSAPQDD